MTNDRMNPDIGVDRETSGTGGDWLADRNYWRANYMARPYVKADRGFEYYEPGYRYGFEEAQRLAGRTWNDVRDDLERGWNEFRYRGEARWDDVRDAARDAWERIKANR
jgi:hypothetical protein